MKNIHSAICVYPEISGDHYQIYELISGWLKTNLNFDYIGDIKINKSIHKSNYPVPPQGTDE